MKKNDQTDWECVEIDIAGFWKVKSCRIAFNAGKIGKFRKNGKK